MKFQENKGSSLFLFCGREHNNGFYEYACFVCFLIFFCFYTSIISIFAYSLILFPAFQTSVSFQLSFFHGLEKKKMKRIL